LASTARLSFDPLESADTATPPAAAAPFMLSPVATLAAEASMFKTGLVVPLAPTASALALADVTTILLVAEVSTYVAICAAVAFLVRWLESAS